MTNASTSTRKSVEVFTAGCPLCDDTVATVRSFVGDAADVRVLDTRDAGVARLQEQKECRRKLGQ